MFSIYITCVLFYLFRAVLRTNLPKIYEYINVSFLISRLCLLLLGSENTQKERDGEVYRGPERRRLNCAVVSVTKDMCFAIVFL